MSSNRKYIVNIIVKIFKNNKNKRVKSKKISNTILKISKNLLNKKSNKRNYLLKKRQIFFKRDIKLVISKIINITSKKILIFFLNLLKQFTTCQFKNNKKYK